MTLGLLRDRYLATHANGTVEANTLYPLLRRLEGQGMLLSTWNTDESRPRKFYRISPAGERLAQELLAEWARIDDSVRRLAHGGTR